MGAAGTDQLIDRHTAITSAQMNDLIEQHIAAELAGDTDGAVAMYTDDVIHDVVGAPHGPLHGPDAAKGFYEFLTSNVTVEQMDVTNARYGDDFCVIEHQRDRNRPRRVPRHPRQRHKDLLSHAPRLGLQGRVHRTRKRVARRQRDRRATHRLNQPRLRLQTTTALGRIHPRPSAAQATHTRPASRSARAPCAFRLEARYLRNGGPHRRRPSTIERSRRRHRRPGRRTNQRSANTLRPVFSGRARVLADSPRRARALRGQCP